MSKKDEKKKKHTGNGSDNQDSSETPAVAPANHAVAEVPSDQVVINKKTYEKELARLQKELIKLQEWIRHQEPESRGHLRGTGCGRQGRRDQAHHRKPQPARLPCGGAARAHRAREDANGTSSATWPTCLPAGEMVLFDRSWYNRAGVERVMGFCTDEENTGIPALGARNSSGCWCAPASSWSSTGSRSATRNRNSASRSASTIRPSAGSSVRWTWNRAPAGWNIRRAKDEMFAHTDIKQAPWYVVNADEKMARPAELHPATC